MIVQGGRLTIGAESNEHLVRALPTWSEPDLIEKCGRRFEATPTLLDPRPWKPAARPRRGRHHRGTVRSPVVNINDITGAPRLAILPEGSSSRYA